MKKLIKKILKEHKEKRYNQPLEEGDIIELIYMDDPYNPISPLTRGIVRGFERVPGGKDKILVTWIVDPENDKLFNMPMIPEVDVWMKLDVDPPTMHTPTGSDSRDSIGRPQRLREQSEIVPGVPVENTWINGKQIQRPIPSKTIFFKAVKQIVETNPGDVLEYDDTNTEDRAYEMDSVLKLFGINSNYNVLINKIFWAASDNRTGIEDGSINSFDDLELRQLKNYRVECYETAVEHVSYSWEPIVEAYSEDDAANIVQMDDDGYYSHWEYDSDPSYDKEYGDTDSDGKEIEQVTEIGPVNESRIIQENESPDENDIIDDLKELTSSKKESIPTHEIKDIITKYINSPINETFVSHSYEPQIGDSVKNNNPGCVHYGSEGVIEDIDDLPDDVGKTITYTVTNDGENYENGDTLTKTMDQLIPLEEYIVREQVEEDLTIHPQLEDNAMRRLIIVLNQMKKYKGWDKYLEDIKEVKKEPSGHWDMKQTINSILKLVGGEESTRDSSSFDKAYWFSSTFMKNGGYGRDFKEGEIELAKLPEYEMEGDYTEEVFEYRTGWGNIVGVEDEGEAIELFTNEIEEYVEDSDSQDSNYGELYDVENVVVQNIRWIKFLPNWVGL